MQELDSEDRILEAIHTLAGNSCNNCEYCARTHKKLSFNNEYIVLFDCYLQDKLGRFKKKVKCPEIKICKSWKEQVFYIEAT